MNILTIRPIPDATNITGPLLGVNVAWHVIVPVGQSTSTLALGFSANRCAITDPEEPEPQTMKS